MQTINLGDPPEKPDQPEEPAPLEKPVPSKPVRPLPKLASCLYCDYKLHGLTTSRCPECGEEFDASDPTTYATGKYRPLKSVMDKTPFPRLWWLNAILVLLILELLSRPYASASTAMHIVEAISALMLLDYLYRAISMIRKYQKTDAIKRRGMIWWNWRWLVVPTALLIVGSALTTNWPLLARFHASKDAMELVAKRAWYGKHPNKGPQMVGWYFVKRIEVTGGVYFVTGRTSVKPTGFTYRRALDGADTRGDPHLPPSWYETIGP